MKAGPGESCKNCKFGDIVIDADVDEPGIVQCHRFPPRLDTMLLKATSEEDCFERSAEYDPDFWIYPSVRPTDWCGEYVNEEKV